MNDMRDACDGEFDLFDGKGPVEVVVLKRIVRHRVDAGQAGRKEQMDQVQGLTGFFPFNRVEEEKAVPQVYLPWHRP